MSLNKLPYQLESSYSEWSMSWIFQTQRAVNKTAVNDRVMYQTTIVPHAPIVKYIHTYVDLHTIVTRRPLEDWWALPVLSPCKEQSLCSPNWTINQLHTSASNLSLSRCYLAHCAWHFNTSGVHWYQNRGFAVQWNSAMSRKCENKCCDGMVSTVRPFEHKALLWALL